MDLTRIGANERLAALAGLVVMLTGLISVVTGWGAILVLAVLAGVGALGVVLAPQLAPSAQLPGANGSLLVLLGAVAVLSWIPPLIVWLAWILDHLITFDAIQFLVGFAFALVLGRTGWVAFQAEGGRLQLGPQAPPARGTRTGDAPAGPRSATAPDAEGGADPDA